MSEAVPIELATAVNAVRDQLLRSAADGATSDVRFEVGPITMEFAVELRREAGVKGGVRAWVVSADADARVSRSDTHRISFTLTPRDAQTGRAWEIGDPEEADVRGLAAG